MRSDAFPQRCVGGGPGGAHERLREERGIELPTAFGGAAQHRGPQSVDVAELVLDRTPGGAGVLGDAVADAAAASPVASARNAASSMASRVAWPRRFVRLALVNDSDT